MAMDKRSPSKKEWSARKGAQRTNKIDAPEGDGQAKPE
jgi:hypothetical protein